jgi:Uma2 family endonuclease
MHTVNAARILPPEVSRFRFTVRQYHRMIETGILHEDDRIELIDGELATMSPINPEHAGKTKRLNRLLSTLVADRAIVSVQDPLVLGDRSEPEPDLMLLRPRDDFYETANPLADDVLLLIEVADTSLDYDRGVKIPLYAANGIPEVWLFDLRRKQLEMHRDPGPVGYREILLPDLSQTISPLSLPAVEIQIAALWG